MPESTRSQKAALLAGVAIGVYFLLYTRLSLLARFTQDDLMNDWNAVFRPLSQTVTDCFLFFRYAPAFRPFGALVYRAAFAVSGFNLRPLRIVLLVLLGLTLVLFYCFVRRLTFSREAGVLAALLASYHLEFWPFYFNTGQLYDILCCFFDFCALAYYLRIRQSGRPLRWYETLIFCGLYLLTLDSKELGVSLPVVIGAWELLFNFPALRLAGLLRWARRDFLPVWVTGIMTAAYIAGRIMAPQGLPQIGGYKMKVSLPAYLEGAGHRLGLRFYAGSYFDAKKTAVFLLAVGFMVKVHDSMEDLYYACQPQFNSIENVRRSFRKLCPTVRKDSRMLIVTDPFGDTYSILFLVQLLYGDSTIQVHQLFRFNPKPDAAALASYDYVFDFKDGKLIRLDPAAYAKAQSGL